MNKPIFMLIIVCFLCCGGAWAPKPGSMVNVSLVEKPAANSYNVILKEPFRNDDDAMYALLTFSWNQKVREILTTVNGAFKYVAAKMQELIDYFEKNKEILRDLHRRRLEVLDMVFRVKQQQQRRDKKVKEASPMKLSPLIKMYPLIKPLSVRLVTKPNPLPSYLGTNLNATTGQPYVMPEGIIVAMI